MRRHQPHHLMMSLLLITSWLIGTGPAGAETRRYAYDMMDKC